MSRTRQEIEENLDGNRTSGFETENNTRLIVEVLLDIADMLWETQDILEKIRRNN